MAEDVRVPALGESITEATIGNWIKKIGDIVALDEPIVELETDKVAVEVNAPAAGVLSEIVAQEGDTVEVGALIAVVGGSGQAAAPVPAAAAQSATAAASAAPSGETVPVDVPALGESITEATIGNWLKAPGDAVAQDEPIAELETDKVAVEVPAPVAGALAEQLAAVGDTVAVGATIATIAAGAAPAKPAASAQPVATGTKPAPAAAPAPVPTASGSAGALMPMPPAVRRILADYNLDPKSITGTGKDGRLTKGDVLSAIENGTAKHLGAATPAPSTAPAAQSYSGAPAGPREERVRMTRLRKRIAERLKESQNTAAILTTYNEADMSAIIAMRNQYKDMFADKHGIKLGFMSFFVKASIQALKEVPVLNASLEDDEIVYKNYYNIGVAVSAPNGLVVPVLKDAQDMSFADTELAIVDYGRKARDGKLALDDLQGGTFTVSNGGIFGSLLSSPIINPPQVGILGMHKIQERPMVMNGEIVARPMMYLSVSYDHRIIDGREAVTFLVRIKDCLEDPGRLMLDL